MRLLFAILLTLPFVAQAQTTCGRDKAGAVEYGWCIYANPKSSDILWYMHGGGSDEKGWGGSDFKDELAKLWAPIGFETPTVISVSFGTTLIGDVDTQEHPALLAPMLDIIMPALEAKIGGLKGKRLIAGHSLGGYNSAELALRAPDRFDRVALLCPGLSTVNPFASDAEIEEYIKKQPSTTVGDLVRGIVGWVRSDFKTQENWDRHDPLKLAASLPAGIKTKFYSSCTKDDEYGFYDAAQKIIELLATKTDARWQPIENGGHCAQNLESLESLAKFLAGR